MPHWNFGVAKRSDARNVMCPHAKQHCFLVGIRGDVLMYNSGRLPRMMQWSKFETPDLFSYLGHRLPNLDFTVDKSMNAKNDREDYLTKPEQLNFWKFHEVIKARLEEVDSCSTVDAELGESGGDEASHAGDRVGMTATFDVTRSFTHKFKAIYRLTGLPPP